MLQLIRDRAQGIVVWTIVGLIIITFALFGLGSYLSGSAKVNVATINGTEISQTEFLRAYQNYQQRLQQMFGKNYRADLFNEAVLKQEVLNGLVTREVLSQSLDETGFTASPEQILEKLHAISAFKDASGKFSSEQYKRALKLQGMNSAMFEQQVARDIADEHLHTGLVSSSFVTDKQLNDFARLQGQQRDIDFIKIDHNEFKKSVSVSEEEIKKYYDANISEFTTEEKVSIEYVELDIKETAKRFDVSDEEIKAYYQQNLKQYESKPEQRRASHILVMDEATAKDLLEKIRAGESFAELAKAHSKDPGSAKQGGDLGFFGRGVMDKAFEESVFSLNKGEVSEPVKSSFGFHLIKLVDIKPGEVKPLKDVRDSIKHTLQVQKAEQQYYADVDKLNNMSYETPDSLAPTAESLGLEVKQTGLFSHRGGQGILANPKVITAAFNKEVLSQGRNSELIELSDTHVMVLRLKDHMPSAPLPVKDVSALIKSKLVTKKAADEAGKVAAEILNKLSSGEQADNVANSVSSASLIKVGFIGRTATKDGNKVNNLVRQAAFTMARPVDGKPVTKQVDIEAGNKAIIILKQIKDGDTATDADKQQLAGAYRNIAYESYVEYLKGQADIKVYTENIQSKQ